MIVHVSGFCYNDVLGRHYVEQRLGGEEGHVVVVGTIVLETVDRECIGRNLRGHCQDVLADTVSRRVSNELVAKCRKK